MGPSYDDNEDVVDAVVVVDIVFVVVVVVDCVFVVVVVTSAIDDVVMFALIQLDSSMLFCLLKKRAVTSIGKLMLKLLRYLTRVKQ